MKNPAKPLFPGSNNQIQLGFRGAGIMSLTPGTPTDPPAQPQKPSKPGPHWWQRKNGKGGNSTSTYEPVAVPPSDEMMRVYAFSLAESDQVLSLEQCTNPLPMLAAVIGLLSASKESPMLPD